MMEYLFWKIHICVWVILNSAFHRVSVINKNSESTLIIKQWDTFLKIYHYNLTKDGILYLVKAFRVFNSQHNIKLPAKFLSCWICCRVGDSSMATVDSWNRKRLGLLIFTSY